jgi:hypothetical protein
MPLKTDSEAMDRRSKHGAVSHRLTPIMKWEAPISKKLERTGAAAILTILKVWILFEIYAR